ncbi:MAG: SMR family transporter [Candidatus Sericytochromatia bacterium]
MTSWVLLFIAGLFEASWAIGLKYTQGFTKLIPSIFTGSSIIISMYLLAKASENLPISTAYSVWVGIGALGASILGIFLFKESFSTQKIFFLGLLVVSIIGLKFS